MKTTEFDYGQLNLETVVIPQNAEKIATKKDVWETLPAYGIEVSIYNAKEDEPWFVYGESDDNKDGLKYHFSLNFFDYSIGMNNLNKLLANKLNKTITNKEDLGPEWGNQFIKFINSYSELKNSTTLHNRTTNARVIIWTTEKNEFPLMLKAITEAIHDVSGISEVAVPSDKTKADYYNIANNSLPKELAPGFEIAMKDYEKQNIEESEIGVIVDVEKSMLLFVLGDLTEDDLHDAKVFSKYACPLIKECDELCNQFDLNNSQEACHWVTDAISIAEKNGAFNNIDNIYIFGNYTYDDSGEMDVVFEKY